MTGINFNSIITNFAKTSNTKLKVVTLKDGSSLNILTKPYMCDIFHVKNDVLLGAKGFRGKNAVTEGSMYEAKISQNIGLKLDGIV